MLTLWNTVIYLNTLFILISGHANSDYDAPQEISFYYDADNAENATWVESDVIKLHNINIGHTINAPPLRFTDALGELKEGDDKPRFYRLKSIIKTIKGKEKVFYSFMKADALVKSGFLASIFIHLDQTGSVICVKLYPKKINNLDVLMDNNSTITFKGTEQGPMPDLTSYILKLEREREAKEQGAAQDKRSFLAKYWMYFIPVLMIALISRSNLEQPHQH